VRVFVLGTGRCGTRTFRMACSHIRNFTSAHESHSRRFIGNLDYPDQHIECDWHLTFMLPALLERYPAGPANMYVHLLRDRAACVDSLSRRRLMDLWAELACFAECSGATPDRRRESAAHFYDSLNGLIDAVLGKPSLASGFNWRILHRQFVVYVEALPLAWPVFWEAIGAEGDYEASLAECSKRYNRGLESKGETPRCEP